MFNDSINYLLRVHCHKFYKQVILLTEGLFGSIKKMNIRAKYSVQLNRQRNDERLVFSYVHMKLY